jgi:hypothetical protein
MSDRDDRDDRMSDTEPRRTTPASDPGKGTEETGNPPVREYPDEGIRSHYPTAPATGKPPASPQADGASEDDPSAA